MSYYYLSNPYNGTAEEKAARNNICAEVCFHLISHKIYVFSPILHNHAMFTHPKNKDAATEMSASERHDFIMQFDLTMLSRANGMIILKILEWELSKGVAKEIEYCESNNIPILSYTFDEVLRLKTLTSNTNKNKNKNKNN